MLTFIIYVLLIIGNWRIFQKMGREGWASIVPFYNLYVEFDALYGDGWNF